MLQHAHIWGAVDALANRHYMAITTFSKHAGLSPALLTDTKRFANNGRPIWPSLPTLAKILTYADNRLLTLPICAGNPLILRHIQNRFPAPLPPN